MRIWDVATGQCLWILAGFLDREAVAIFMPENKIMHATKGAWRYLGWNGWNKNKQRWETLPAETFGELPE
jgi:hypothetical protein